MKRAQTVLLMLVFTSGLGICRAADLPRSTPEEQGISSDEILKFVEAVDQQANSLHSLMILRHGRVVAEGWWAPYRRDAKHQLYSLSKSFTSTGVGIAIAEGKLRLDDPVLKFFPDEAPEKPSDQLKAMRVSDLLRMSTGHDKEPPRPKDESWRKAFLAQPVPFKPGTHFLYNTSATYMLSAIVQKATGQTMLDYLKPRLFDPLGIENPTWEANADGESVGGYGLNVRTEDIARFGQLYLQRGQWNGKQLVPADWVDAATARQTSNGSNPQSDWDQGYGYQFWRCRNGGYRGDGAFGQYCIVLPEQDAVIAITSGLGNMQLVLDLVWSKLLPAFKTEKIGANSAAHKELVKRLAGLTLPAPTGSVEGAAAAKKTYLFADNDRLLESISLQAEKDGSATILAKFKGQEQRIACGAGQWRDGSFTWGATPEQPGAASGGWSDKQTYTAKLCFYETPFMLTLKLKFEGDEVVCRWESNVSFGPRGETELKGRASP